jgi:YaiO family outer membrane protein
MYLAVSAVTMQAQTPDTSVDTPPDVNAATILPFRLEVGGYGTYFQNAGGWWRGVDATLWIRRSPKFIPALTFDNRTSNTGTERYYSFLSYANWTSNFFTTQSISGTPETGDKPLLFPRFRYDVKAWFKMPPRRSLVAGLGVTRYTFDHGLSGVILNPGFLYYRGRFVFDGEGFINRNQPGNLWSGSGQLTVQRGQEGQHWAGVTIGGGHQTYRELENLPLALRFASISVDAFYRRWLTRHVGFVLSGGYQNAFHTYQRASVGAHVFFEF